MFDLSGWRASGRSIHEPSQQRQPLRRLQSALHRSLDVAIPFHVELLNKHRTNINKFRQLHDWHNVHREQINASRTVEQLKADIWSLDLLRSQLIDTDVAEFDKQTKKTQDLVVCAVQQFSDAALSSPTTQTSNSRTSIDYVETETFGQVASSQTLENSFLQIDLEETLQLDLQQVRRIEASWNQLVKDLQDLNETMTTLSSCVRKQAEELNSIESNLEVAQENVAVGNKYLAKAVKYKTMLYPLSGAVLGGCIGGPVGLLVGLKAGAAALAICGIIGFQTGRLLKRKQVKSVEMELYQLEQRKYAQNADRKTTSLPDLRMEELDDGYISIEKKHS